MKYLTSQEAIGSLTHNQGEPSARWTYTDAYGDPVGLVLRWDTVQGKLIRPVSRRGEVWVVGAMEEPRPLYRLPDLAGADRVYLVEGEKAADAARSVGLTATTSSGGAKAAGKSDWSPLTGKDVVIVPDNDDPGREYARQVSTILAGIDPRPRVRLITLPDVPEAGDMADYLDRCAGQTPDQVRADLEALVGTTGEIDLDGVIPSQIVLVRMSDVQPQPVRWLRPGRIALGKVTMLAGDPGLGKSFLTLDIAGRVSSGSGWPDDRTIVDPPAGVVLLTAEDDLADTVRPRLDAAGADVLRITALAAVKRPDSAGKMLESPLSLETDILRIEEAIDRTLDCRLVIIDPITAYCGKVDSHKNAEIRGLLAPLVDLATRRGVAVLAVTHLNKSSGDQAIYRTMGSLAFTAAARAVWSVSKDSSDPRRRLMLPVKNNLAHDVNGLAYRLEPGGMSDTPVVAWEPDPITMTADEALGCLSAKKGNSIALEEAEDWLAEMLACGPIHAKEIKDRAKEDGIASRTLDRAKKKLGVTAVRQGFGDGGKWVWALPQGAVLNPPELPYDADLEDETIDTSTAPTTESDLNSAA